MKGRTVPYGVYGDHVGSLGQAMFYAPWVALAYAVLGRVDQAEDIMSCMRELRTGSGKRSGPRGGKDPNCDPVPYTVH